MVNGVLTPFHLYSPPSNISKGVLMEIIEVDAYYLPPDFRGQVKAFRTEAYQDGDITIHLKIPQISRSFVETLADHLKKSRETYLAGLPIGKIIDVLDQASRRWLERDYPLRKLALKTIPAITHFSREVVEASIDVEMESSLREDIWRALCSEIKNPLFLDDFQYSPELAGLQPGLWPEAHPLHFLRKYSCPAPSPLHEGSPSEGRLSGKSGRRRTDLCSALSQDDRRDRSGDG